MATEIKAGDFIDMAGARTGQSDRGDWLLVRIGEKKGISIFADNVAEAREIHGKAKIERILGVKKKAYKLPNGQWATDSSVEITATLVRPDDNDLYAMGGFVNDDSYDPNMPFN